MYLFASARFPISAIFSFWLFLIEVYDTWETFDGLDRWDRLTDLASGSCDNSCLRMSGEMPELFMRFWSLFLCTWA
jgi:hypothetical protein